MRCGVGWTLHARVKVSPGTLKEIGSFVPSAFEHFVYGGSGFLFSECDLKAVEMALNFMIRKGLGLICFYNIIIYII